MDAETRALAAALLARLGAEKSRSLRELRDLFVETLPPEKWKASWIAQLLPGVAHFGDRPADEIGAADWVRFRDQVWAKTKTRRKRLPEPTTLNQGMKLWRAVYRFGRKHGYCSTDPLAGVPKLRAKKHRMTNPSDEDVARLLPFCDDRLRAFVLVAFRGGCRASEVRTLEWRQIDLEAGRIALRAGQTKTRKARGVRITSDAVQALEAIRPNIPGRYVFPSPVTGGPLAATTLWTHFSEARRQAKLEAADGDVAVRYHDLRRGFAKRAVRAGVRIEVLSKMLAHSTVAQTQDYIDDGDDDPDLDAAQVLLEAAVRKPAQRAQNVSEQPRKDLRVTDS
jgi:integrase